MVFRRQKLDVGESPYYRYHWRILLSDIQVKSVFAKIGAKHREEPASTCGEGEIAYRCFSEKILHLCKGLHKLFERR